ncbi:MAG: MFS transporter [Pontiellaceae bacterium]|nr:MFS transporter [Pontiellaceae bacterium]
MKGITNKVSIGEKIGYGLGDTASNLFFQITIYWMTAFYLKTFGIKTDDLTVMFLITKIWDAVNDPIMGAIADKTRSKWGTYRPYLLFAAIPFGIIFLFTFTTPAALGLEFNYVAKLAYAYVTYTLMMTIYTVINVPYAALMGVISTSPTERTVISTFRFVLVFIAQFIVQFALMFMVAKFGDGSETSIYGWQRAIMVLAILAVVLFLITFFTTRERTTVAAHERHSFLTNIKDISGNFPWLLIAGATVFQLMFVCLRGGDITLYFEDYVKTQTVFGHDVTSTVLKTNYLLWGTFFTIAGAVMTKWFTRIMGKSATYCFFMLVVAVSCVPVFFLKPDQVVLMFVLQFATSFALGPVSVLQWAIYTDTADYQEWKNNRRSTAFIMAASLFALKMGVAFGSSALTKILSIYKYAQPTAEQQALIDKGVTVVIEQPESALTGIRMAMSIFPAITAILAMAFMLFYPLRQKKLDEIEEDLKARRDAKDNAETAEATA